MITFLEFFVIVAALMTALGAAMVFTKEHPSNHTWDIRKWSPGMYVGYIGMAFFALGIWLT